MKRALVCGAGGFIAHEDTDGFGCLPLGFQLQEGTDLEDAGGDIHFLEIGQDADKRRLCRIFVPVVDNYWQF